MRSPQLVVYEHEHWVADLLRGTAGTWGWTLRELRDGDALVRTLVAGGPAVVVLEVGRDLERDLAMLGRVAAAWPEAAVVAVLNVVSPELAGLAWELGAVWVFGPPQPRDALLPLVLALMESARPPRDGTRAGPAEGGHD